MNRAVRRFRLPSPARIPGLIRAVAITLPAVLLAALPVMARQGEPPVTLAGEALELSRVPVLELGAIDRERLLAEDDARRSNGPAPLRFADPVDLRLTPEDAGSWETLADGRRLWRLQVHAPGATDLNFGFTRYRLPAGAMLHVYSEDEGYYEGPYTHLDNEAHGQLWTPVVPGERAVLELVVPAAPKHAPVLELTRAGRGYRDLFGRLPLPESGACNIDVVCPEGDLWREQIRSAALYAVDGFLTCSGQMINDVPQDCRHYFLTADHCGVRAGNAPSMVVYWNYEASACRGSRNGSLAQNQTGAAFRSRHAGPDFTLVELDDPPDPLFAVYYSGFDARTTTAPQGSVAIHHPNVDEKAISFNTDPLTTTASCIGGTTPSSHWRVNNWEQGTTEPGSSGGGLWDPQTQLLVGQLSGGLASCSNIDYDCFGKTSVGWDVGTGAASRLRDWLDPANTGQRFVAGRECTGAVAGYSSHQGSDFCSQDPANENGTWEPGEEVEVAVEVVSTGPLTNVRGTLTSSTPGVTIVDGQAAWPDLAAGVPAQSVAPHFRIQLDAGLPCFSSVDLLVDVTANEGGPFASSFSQAVGVPLAGGPTTINDEATVTSTLAVSDDVVLTGVDVEVEIEHTWVGDLLLVLESPAGTMVTLLDRPGVPASTNGCGDADMIVTFDDASAVDLESRCAGTSPWYSGIARPVGELSALNGQRSAGTWRLHVTDAAAGDTGEVTRWALRTQPAVSGQCRPCGVRLAVHFGRVEAVRRPGGVEVRWWTVLELDTLGFRVRRGDSPAGPFADIGRVAARGAGHVYSVIDGTAGTRSAWYEVVEVTADGVGDRTPPFAASEAVPGRGAGARRRIRGR